MCWYPASAATSPQYTTPTTKAEKEPWVCRICLTNQTGANCPKCKVHRPKREDPTPPRVAEHISEAVALEEGSQDGDNSDDEMDDDFEEHSLATEAQQ